MDASLHITACFNLNILIGMEGISVRLCEAGLNTERDAGANAESVAEFNKPGLGVGFGTEFKLSKIP